MSEIKDVQIVMFYLKENINSFSLNNEIYEIFKDYLEFVQPKVFSIDEKLPLPLSVWISDSFELMFSKERMDIHYKNISSIKNLLNEKNHLCELSKKIGASINRMGIVVNFSADNNVLINFKEKYKIDIFDKKEFKFDWLDTNDTDKYNFWTRFELFNKKYTLTFDINTMMGNTNFNVENVFDFYVNRINEESKKWNV